MASDDAFSAASTEAASHPDIELSGTHQPYLHRAATNVAPLDAANFPVAAVDSQADLTEYISPHQSGFVVDKEGYKVVTFTPGDPSNPRNWSKGYKWLCTLLVSLLCFAVSFGSAVVTGDIEGVMEQFGVSQEVVILTVTLFVIGFGMYPFLERNR